MNPILCNHLWSNQIEKTRKCFRCGLERGLTEMEREAEKAERHYREHGQAPEGWEVNYYWRGWLQASPQIIIREKP